MRCDANGDGQITEADLAIILRSLGAHVSPNDPRDVDMNGQVTTQDYWICKAHMNDPEPATIPTLGTWSLIALALLVAAIGAWWSHRRASDHDTVSQQEN